MLLGGDVSPLGLCMQYVEAPEADVASALTGIFQGLESTTTSVGLPQSLHALLPLQAPWTRMLTAQVGQWTAALNNGIHGGDGTSPGPALARELGVRCVVASSVPRFGPGHAQTQWEVWGPGGAPPLMHVRSVSVSATDGRWEFHQGGDPLPFEDCGRYRARLKRHRFDRSLLLSYLGALGVPTADEAYGVATLHQQRAATTSREVTLEEEQRTFGVNV